jgi:hypothetical protein
MACLAGPSFHEANGSCACVLVAVKATAPTSAAANRFCLPRRSAAKAGVGVVFIVLTLLFIGFKFSKGRSVTP